MNLTPEDHDKVLRVLPAELRLLMEQHKNKLFIAGGFIRDTIIGHAPRDIDVFSVDQEFAQGCAGEFSKIPGKAASYTGNAITVSGSLPPVQFVYRWTFKSAEDCINSFDFTVACAAMWFDGSKWLSVCVDEFYPDLAGRNLRYRRPPLEGDAGGSILRVLKFYQRGYSISMESLAGVMIRAQRASDANWMRSVLGNDPIVASAAIDEEQEAVKSYSNFLATTGAYMDLEQYKHPINEGLLV